MENAWSYINSAYFVFALCFYGYAGFILFQAKKWDKILAAVTSEEKSDKQKKKA